MNIIILLAIIGVGAVVVIAGIIAFQFIQEQSALNKLDKMLNPEPVKQYEECLKRYESLSQTSKDIICENEQSKTPYEQCKEDLELNKANTNESIEKACEGYK
jgi:hypothetical protein